MDEITMKNKRKLEKHKQLEQEEYGERIWSEYNSEEQDLLKLF
jgi:hypothetical protein